ncbi:hypothetical protein FYU92_19520 [Vibrio cholerae]|nr:hypothetical protein [Vibrio cholerae]EGR1037921.1 hypothetical protein [Vibrio cholerae]EGR1041870.1 hypothetical protein [Vibrio cholerae]EGR2420635.1 hypothetical protein [Vibrio cholerae]MEB5541879.1 hypothetical protein [Vibrio cholerae]
MNQSVYLVVLEKEFCGQKSANKRLKRDCQRVAFPVPISRSGYGCYG